MPLVGRGSGSFSLASQGSVRLESVIGRVERLPSRAQREASFIWIQGPAKFERSLVSCPINNVAFVAIKMGRRQGARRAHILIDT
jgi:hypothetical protein